MDEVRVLNNLRSGWDKNIEVPNLATIEDDWGGPGAYPSLEEREAEWERIVADDFPKDVMRLRLAELDSFLSRETEDIIKTMIQKGIISISDLPQILVDRYNEKETLRSQL